MNHPSSQILVIVDGYSSGSQLPGVMRERGWDCVHVTSVPEPEPYFLASFRADDYIDHLAYDGDLSALVEAVEKYRPAAVTPGTESGVYVADALAAALGLPGNDPATSASRRDKYVMHNALRAAALRSMDHHLTTDLDDLIAWARRGSWPVVVKPPASAGTDSVIFCDDVDAVAAAFRRVNGSTNQLGGVNHAVLAQQFLVGQEYFVNGISAGGRHLVSEVWRADKVAVAGASYIYDKAVLFDPYDPQVRALVAYVCDVVETLGIRWGAHHTEVMMTDAGPTLVECASRLSGGLHRPAANTAVGASQLDLLGNLVARGDSYVTELADAWEPNLPLWQTQFISYHKGTVVDAHYEDLVATLNSRAWLQRAPKPGDPLVETTDLYSSPGIVFMHNTDTNELQADHDTVRRWEREDRLVRVA